MSADYLKNSTLDSLKDYFSHPKPIDVCLPHHKSWIVRKLENSPLFGKLLLYMHASGRSVYNLNQLSGAFLSTSRTVGSFLGQLTRLSSVGVAIFNFLFIPVYYLGSKLFTGSYDVTAGNNGKWVLAAILLAHAIVALIAPPMAIVMAISAALVTCAAGVITVGYNIYLALHAKNQIARLRDQKSTHEQTYNILLKPLIDAFLKNPNDATKNELLESYIPWHNRMQDLVNKKHLEEGKLKKLKYEDIPDKTVLLLLSVIIVIGVITSLWFPIAGAMVLASSALLGLGYIGARCTYTLGKTLYGQTRKHVIPEKPAFVETYRRLNKEHPGFMTMGKIDRPAPATPNQPKKRRRYVSPYTFTAREDNSGFPTQPLPDGRGSDSLETTSLPRRSSF